MRGYEKGTRLRVTIEGKVSDPPGYLYPDDDSFAYFSPEAERFADVQVIAPPVPDIRSGHVYKDSAGCLYFAPVEGGIVDKFGNRWGTTRRPELPAGLVDVTP